MLEGYRLRTGNIGNMQRGRGVDRGEVGRGDVTERVTEAKRVIEDL